MLKGVNDTPAEARALVRLLKGVPAKINLIPFNPWPGSPYECSDWETIERFSEIVFNAGYASPVRTPRGRDILAACGQLKSESEKLRARARMMLEEKSGRWTRLTPARIRSRPRNDPRRSGRRRRSTFGARCEPGLGDVLRMPWLGRRGLVAAIGVVILAGSRPRSTGSSRTRRASCCASGSGSRRRSRACTRTCPIRSRPCSCRR